MSLRLITFSIILSGLFTSFTVRSSVPASKFLYTYREREHTATENASHLGALYAIGWFSYYVTQPETFEHKGSWRNYRNNFGKIVFDKDEPYWNWIGHPYTGSQVYLYYRANGYSRLDSFYFAFWQSALFEFTTEIYTERASIQDLYQTPVLGSVLGLFLEHTSLLLLNTHNPLLEIVGHIMNPSTLFWFYEGKIVVTPQVDQDKVGYLLMMDF